VRARVETSKRVETHAVNGLWRKPQRENANRQPDLRATIAECGRNLVNLDVNKSQKILTATFLILLTLSLLFFPWGDEYGRNFPRLLSPLWIPPRDFGLYPAEWTTHVFYPDWIMAIIVWAWLGIVYVGLLFILKPPSK
jgi:hypothetical protein